MNALKLQICNDRVICDQSTGFDDSIDLTIFGNCHHIDFDDVVKITNCVINSHCFRWKYTTTTGDDFDTLKWSADNNTLTIANHDNVCQLTVDQYREFVHYLAAIISNRSFAIDQLVE